MPVDGETQTAVEYFLISEFPAHLVLLVFCFFFPFLFLREDRNCDMGEHETVGGVKKKRDLAKSINFLVFTTTVKRRLSKRRKSPSWLLVFWEKCC